ncbi:MAG: pitrilysin family protein [Terriglobia bacterium]|jgi:predicted Zn-dependent peptidase
MKRSSWILFVAICLAALTSARAQAPGGDRGTAASEVQRLNRAPVNKEVLRVKLPKPRQIKLANGLTVLVLEQHKLPTVAFTLWVETGALADPKDLPGLAKATAEMLREGTAHRSSAQLASDVDGLGASLGASADFGADTSTISASGLSESVDRLLELMSDVVLNPTFPPDEFSIYQKRQLAQVEQMRSRSAFLAQERLHQVLYGDFAAAVVTATPQSLKTMSSAQLKDFHDRYYVPNNALLGVVGDVQFDQVVSLIQKHFGAWKSHPVAPPDLGKISPPAASKVTLVDRPDSVQTNILAGEIALRRADPDFIPLTVMNRVVGGGASGRLFLNLREKHGYTYGAYSSFTSDIYPGVWRANTEVRNAVTDGSLHELMEEFKRIRAEPVPEPELDEARRAIVASFALSLEQPSTLLNFWMTANYYRLPQDYWERYPEQVAKVTPEVVERVAKKYVDLDHLQIVCVGDGKQIKEILKKYGPLEVYDVDGKRLE